MLIFLMLAGAAGITTDHYSHLATENKRNAWLSICSSDEFTALKHARRLPSLQLSLRRIASKVPLVALFQRGFTKLSPETLNLNSQFRMTFGLSN